MSVIAKISRMLLLCVAVLLFTVHAAARQEVTLHKVAGTYYSGHGYAGGWLTLDANGRFSLNSASDDGSESSTSGTYVLSEGSVHFTVLQQMEKGSREKRETNPLEPGGRKGVTKDTGKIISAFSLLPITWSDRIYLIDEKDLNNFSHAINLGLEPRSLLRSEPYYGAFYLRKGDELKSVSGKPSLPPSGLSLLLSKPVAATVISIEESRKETYWSSSLATINKGRADGLKAGMRLLINDEEPSISWGAEIISVAEKTARVRTLQSNTNLKVGDMLSTGGSMMLCEYGALGWHEEKAHLAKFAARLETMPTIMGYVIAYAGRRARAGEAMERANRARAYLEGELKMERGRIVAVDGGYREHQAVELFAVPIVSKYPVPTPTVDPTKVQIIVDKVKRNKRRRRATATMTPDNGLHPTAKSIALSAGRRTGSVECAAGNAGRSVAYLSLCNSKGLEIKHKPSLSSAVPPVFLAVDGLLISI